MFYNRHQKVRLSLAILAGIALSASAISCSGNFFAAFKVERTFLADGTVVAQFSADIDAASAKRNFSFIQDETQVDGQMAINGSCLTFVPNVKIGENHCYKIQFFSGTMDTRGNALERDYCATIWTKNDLTPPEVLSAKADEKGIEFVFSEGVERKSFFDNFSLEPQKEFLAVWKDGDKKLELFFNSPLEEKTLHSIQIKTGLKDKSNNFLKNNFYWSWTSEGEALAPDFSFYARRIGQSQAQKVEGRLDGADFDSDIELRFSKEVDWESVSSSIETEPRLPFNVVPVLEENGKYCRIAKIKFEKWPKWNQSAVLTVKEKITDKDGRRAIEKSIELANDAEEKRPPKLEFVAIKVLDKFKIADQEKNFASVSFPLTDYPEGVEKELPAYFLYSISGHSEHISRLAAMEATGVECNSCANVILLTMESIRQENFSECADFWADSGVQERLRSLAAQKKKLALIKCGASFKNRLLNEKPACGLIEFSVSQKLCDENKNFMEEKALVSFNKN